MAGSSSAIPVGERVGPVTVAHVERPDKVWVCPDQLCGELTDELYRVAGSLERMDSNEVRVGVVTATHFSEDQELYRAEVLQVFHPDEVAVRFIDYGNCEKVKISSLFTLPPSLEKAAKLAVQVSVDGVDPLAVGNSEKNRARIKKKLSKAGLEVELNQVAGTLVASFFSDGKKIKFSKSKEAGPEAESKEGTGTKEVPSNELRSKTEWRSGKEEYPEEAVELVEKSVKLVKSGDAVTMASQLPSLKLLEDVEITGFVQHVSPVGTAWFTPSWIQGSLDNLTEQVVKMDEEKRLVPVSQAELCLGMLCIALHTEYDSLFRARINGIDGAEVSVKYIDYGDGGKASLTNLFHFPAGLDMLAPAVAEIVLARTPPKVDTQRILEELLVSEEEVVLKLEIEESGVKVGRFYRNGKEVTWEGLIKTSSVYSREERTEAKNEDDVVLESEKIIEPKPEPNVSAEPEPTKPEATQPTPEVVVNAKPTAEATKGSQEKLFKMKPAIPLVADQETAVSVTHVETVNKVWVSRLEDEEAVQTLMENLSGLGDGLTLATRKRKGAVFAATYPEDGELYRVVLLDKAGPGQVKVQFIDFGNISVISVDSLLVLPETLAMLPCYAISVEFSSGLQESPENLDLVHTLLAGDGEVNLTVRIVEGIGNFKAEGVEVVFGAREDLPQQEDLNVRVPESETSEEIFKLEESKDPEKKVKKVKDSSPQQKEEVVVKVPVKEDKKILIPPRVFEKALSNLKTNAKKQPWVAGDSVVARFPDGNWCLSKVLDWQDSGVLVSSPSGEAVLVGHSDVKSSSLPTDALNKIERDINRNVREDAGGAGREVTVEEKKALALPSVADCNKEQGWIAEIPLVQKPVPGRTDRTVKEAISQPKLLESSLPAMGELAKYSTTTKGSRHLQSVISARDNKLNRAILESLLKSDISTYTVMTGTVSTYVVQKLISVLPPALLDPVVTEVVRNFTQLSVDSTGCHLVQALLKAASPAQQQAICSLLCQKENIVVLAFDTNGTFVAQACLSLLSSDQEKLERLAVSLLGKITNFAVIQSSSFLLQKMINLLAASHPVSESLVMMIDEIIQGLDKVAYNEPGSRLVQEMIKHCQEAHLLFILRWIELRLKLVIVSKPAVYLALAVLQCLATRSSNSRAWAFRLGTFTSHFINSQDLLLNAALHPTGHLLAKELVALQTQLSTKKEVTSFLRLNLDALTASKTGIVVLKALE